MAAAVKAVSVAAPSSTDSASTGAGENASRSSDLGGGCPKIVVRQQRRQRRRVDAARRGSGAVGVVRRPGALEHPVVDERIAGPRVERQHAPALADPGHVGDAADVHERDGKLAELGGERAVVDRHQRRPLPAGGDVGCPEIEHDIGARALGEQPAVAELHRHSAVGVVQHRLAVIADEIDLGRVDAVGPHEAQRRLGVELGERPLDLGQRARPVGARGQGAGLADRAAQRHFDLGGIGIGGGRPVAQLAVPVGLEQGHVDAVHRGSAHQAERAQKLAH